MRSYLAIALLALIVGCATNPRAVQISLAQPQSTKTAEQKVPSYEASKEHTCSSMRQLSRIAYEKRAVVSRDKIDEVVSNIHKKYPQNSPAYVLSKYAVAQAYESKTLDEADIKSYEKCLETFDILIKSYLDGLPISEILN